jgi:uncharacterized protein YjiS (DUF1127 family)
MQYQNQARRVAWNDDPQDQRAGSFEIVGFTVSRAASGEPHRRRIARSPDRWRQAIDRAIATAMNELVEGLALCAASLHPQFFFLPSEPVDYVDPPEAAGRGRIVRTARPSLALLLREEGASQPAGSHPAVPASPQREPAMVGPVAAPVDAIPAASPGWIAWTASGFARLWTRLRAEREFRRSRAALHALTDRDLDDIGITRSDIERAIRQGRGLR